MPRPLHRFPNASAFTLIELLVAIAASALIAAAALSLFFTLTGSLRRQSASRREAAWQALDRIRRDIACALPTSVTSSPPLSVTAGDDSSDDLTLTTATLDGDASLSRLQVWNVRYRLAGAAAGDETRGLIREAALLAGPSSPSAGATGELFRGASRFSVQVLAGPVWTNRWTPSLRQPLPPAVRVSLEWPRATTTETVEVSTALPVAQPIRGRSPVRPVDPRPPVSAPVP